MSLQGNKMSMVAADTVFIRKLPAGIRRVKEKQFHYSFFSEKKQLFPDGMVFIENTFTTAEWLSPLEFLPWGSWCGKSKSRNKLRFFFFYLVFHLQ